MACSMTVRHCIRSRKSGDITMDENVYAYFVVRILRVLRERRRKKNRRYWVHPLNISRLTSGQFYVLFNDFKCDREKFFNYFRMSPNSFDELLTLLTPHISAMDTNMRLCIPSNEKLAVTLRYESLLF